MVRRFFQGTRGRLTITHAVVLTVALLIADVTLYFIVLQVEQGSADNLLRAQASTISAGIEDVNGQVTFGGGDLPNETQQGVPVESAIVSLSGPTQLQTPTQSIRPQDLTRIVAAARRAGTPIMFDVTDVHGAARRVFAETLVTGQAQGPVRVVSRGRGEVLAARATGGVWLGL